MRKWNKIRVNTKVDNWRYIPAEMNNSGILSYVVLFDKFRLLSTCLTGPEFLAPNNQKYDFEGLKEETSDDEVRIKTTENRTAKQAKLRIGVERMPCRKRRDLRTGTRG